ncbi:MAG: phosphatidate cytidylyltransferase [Armatimonadota bacterium]|nr:phosphatidate cytidylyltransferase [Armatimonadota bacterium]MDR5704023.1 phosphatidate cytidylyltransferase [Armatimonadota bacterium]
MESNFQRFPKLWLRFVTAAVGLPIVVAAVWWGGAPLLLLLALLAAAGIGEFDGLARGWGFRPLTVLEGAGVALFLILAHARMESWLFPGMAALVMTILLAHLLHGRRLEAVADAAMTLLGVLYIGFLLSFLLWIRSLPQGRFYTLLVLAAVWSTDAVAYFVGLTLGRHPLSPHISPRKSWEGAIAGLAGGVGGAALLGRLLGLPVSISMALGGSCSVAGQLGDLVESALKRSAGVKDSGGLLPGHGGVLDRFDALFFAAPVGYIILVILGAR